MGALTDRCAVCGKPECGYPARERDGKAVFEYGGGESDLTPVQMATLKADHAYDKRNGKLGTRPIAERPTSVSVPPPSDWTLQVCMWVLIALLLAMAWYGVGCGAAVTSNILDRTETALRLLQCVEQSLPPAGSGVVSGVSPTAAPKSVADAGAPTIRGIDETDPWWEPDASDARVENVRPGGE